MTTGRTTAVRPPGEGGAVSRERILEVAAEQLRRLPLSKLTMEDVARAAGTSRQTVYRYVGSKEEMLIALFVQQIVDVQHPRLQELADAEKPSPDTLTRIILAELELAMQYTLLDEVLDPAVAPRMAELVFKSNEMTDANALFWIPLLKDYRDAQIVREDLDLDAATRWIIYQQFWLLTHPGALCTPEELPMYVREFIVQAMLRP